MIEIILLILIPISILMNMLLHWITFKRIEKLEERNKK